MCIHVHSLEMALILNTLKYSIELNRMEGIECIAC